MNARKLLLKLLSHFYESGGSLAWSYVEDTRICEIDPKLERALKKFLAEQKEQKEKK